MEQPFKKYLSKLKLHMPCDKENPLLLSYVRDMTIKLSFWKAKIIYDKKSSSDIEDWTN